jgi:hypothetical protein
MGGKSAGEGEGQRVHGGDAGIVGQRRRGGGGVKSLFTSSALTKKAVETTFTPPPRTRTKIKRLAFAEAQEADAAATRARKKSKVIVQKNVKHTHSQRMQELQNNEVCMLRHLTERFFGLIFS